MGFYKAAAGKAADPELHAVFRLLARVEAEHVNVLRRLLGVTQPVTVPEVVCEEADKDNLQRAMGYEEQTAEFFTAAAAEAFEERAVEVFAALGEADGEHLVLLRRSHVE